ncbi:MAG: hypothetical protein JST14_18540 [Bacteroidetes bacterium]|nr:hypothetical protein [Bacteroidota bacterium]
MKKLIIALLFITNALTSFAAGNDNDEASVYPVVLAVILLIAVVTFRALRKKSSKPKSAF